jgi:hypothetical protein
MPGSYKENSMKYRFFVSSSSEQKGIGEALEKNLKKAGFEPTLWCRDAHEAAKYNLEALINHTKTSDFAVFVFAPDDRATIRGQVVSVVRDNVLFEFGLFNGALGRDHCFIVHGIERPPRLPTDLDGLTTLQYYERRSDGDLSRALGPATTSIAKLAHATAGAAASQFTDNDLRLLRSCSALSMPSNQAYKAFGSAPAAWDDKLCMRFIRLQEHGLIKRTGDTEVETTGRGNLLAAAARSS